MYRALNAIWAARIPHNEKVILIYLLSRAGAPETESDVACWPSIQRMAADVDLAERTVRYALARLRDRGLVSWERTPGRVSVYRIHVDRLMAGGHMATSEEGGEVRHLMPGGPATDAEPPAPHAEESGISCRGVRHLMPEGSGTTCRTNRTIHIEHSIELKNTIPSTVATHTVSQPGEPQATRRLEGHVGTPKTQDTPSNRGLNSSSGKTIPAAAAEPAPGTDPRPATDSIQAHFPGPRPTGFPYSPERGALVRELRSAGLWERFNGLLRRHARDERAWWAWLDRLAPERERLNGHFPEAVRAALDRLEAWPDARYPFSVVEKVVREYVPPPPKPEPDPYLAAGEAVREGDFDALVQLIQVLASANEDEQEGVHVA